MNIHGERFAGVGLFIGYCKDLNVQADERELEHYEKTGVMLPVARLVYPDEYVIQRDQRVWNGVSDGDELDEWPDLRGLTERLGPFPHGYGDLADDELVHCFDRELEAGDNPYLHRPSTSNFRPWSEYRVLVHDRHGHGILRPTAEHYYCYWQVHQLHFIQRYPDLHKNAWLVDRLPADEPWKIFFPRAPKKERLAEFEGMRRSFDALSFWITAYARERNRTFASVAEKDGFRRLDDVQADYHQKRLTAYARMVSERFQLTSQDLYEFLRQLIKLYDDYGRDERYKLSEELKRDIFCWEDLLKFITGETRDEVADELGKVNRFDKQTFRHLLAATKERDYSLDLLNRVAESCGRALRGHGDSSWSFAEPDVNSLLDYCEQESLGLLPTALSGMVATGDEEYRRNFRRVQMYTNLKNVLTSYEYLLKDLAVGSGLSVGKNTLTQTVVEVMGKEPWFTLFKGGMQKGLLNAKDTQEFLTNLGTLLGDNNLKGSKEGYWARMFLVTCLARNMTVHTFPEEDRYYGDLFGQMLDAVIIVMFYTWKFAHKENWI